VNAVEKLLEKTVVYRLWQAPFAEAKLAPVLANNDITTARRVLDVGCGPARAMYYLFYRLLAQVSDMRMPLDAGYFGLISSRVAAQLREMPEHHRYLRGLRSWVGFRQVGVEVERDQRYAGESKYKLVRLVKLGTDGIFAFSTIPIRAATALGALATLFSCLYALYSVVAKVVFNQPPRGFTALVTLISFRFGIQLIFLGIIGEYVGRTYEEVKSRPLYIICKMMTKGEVTSSRNALAETRTAARG
jgi:hypothetical protein